MRKKRRRKMCRDGEEQERKAVMQDEEGRAGMGRVEQNKGEEVKIGNHRSIQDSRGGNKRELIGGDRRKRGKIREVRITGKHKRGEHKRQKDINSSLQERKAVICIR